MFTLLLCGLALAPSDRAEDPHPDRTTFLGPLPRLLDWLDVPAAERARLAKSAAERETARDRLERLDPAARRSELEDRAAVRQQSFVWQLSGELGEARVRRLAGLAMRQWGDQAAFAPGLAERLDIAADQKAGYRRWRERDPDAAPPEKLVADAQRRKAEQWLGTPPSFAVELRLAAEERRAAASQLPNDVALRLDPFRPVHLLSLEETAAALRLPPAERRSLRAWALAGLREETAAVAPQGPADTVPARHARAAALGVRFAAESAERLGAERAKRFAELRRQLAGWGGAFGEEHRGELGIAPVALQKAFADASAAVDRLHDAPGGFNAAAARQACDAALQSCLSEEQRRQWRRRCGTPFPEETLHAVRRAAERP